MDKKYEEDMIGRDNTDYASKRERKIWANERRK